MSTLPPHTVLDMPALSPTMTTGNIATFKFKVGDKVSPGDLICDIETDKASIGWEAQEEGYVAAILVPDGTNDVPVGTPVLVIADSAGDVAALKDFKPSGGGAAPTAAATAAPAAVAAAGTAASAPPGKSYPSHVAMEMPALSPTMTAGNIASIKVKAGDKILPGDLIMDIETDKATMGWEAQEEGIVAKVLVSDGQQDVSVGQVVLVMVDDAASIADFADYSASTAAAAAPPSAAPSAPAAPAPAAAVPAPAPAPAPGGGGGVGGVGAPARTSGGRVLASPLARALAAEAGVELSMATPTGPHGRVIAADVMAAIESGAAASGSAAAMPGVPGQDFSEIKHSSVRKVIAKRLLESKTTVPHYYLSMDICADELSKLRETLNAKAKKDKEGKPAYKLSINDFIIKASALALRDHPDVNSSWMTDAIRQYNYVDISVAVASPTGLITPIVTDADMKGLTAISEEVKALAGKAREGKLLPHEYQGGTFSISNLGMFGISSFAAIINPPQSCILAVGASEQRVVPGKDGSFKTSEYMRVTLSCDHRTVDGAVGAAFLQSLKGYLSNPTSMLL